MNEVKVINYTENHTDVLIDLIKKTYPNKTIKADEESLRLCIEKCLRDSELSVFSHLFITLDIVTIKTSFNHMLLNDSNDISFTVNKEQVDKFFILPKEYSQDELKILYSKVIKKTEEFIDEVKTKFNDKKEFYDLDNLYPNLIQVNFIASGSFLDWYNVLKRFYDKTNHALVKDLYSEIYRHLYKIAPLLFNKYNFKIRT